MQTEKPVMKKRGLIWGLVLSFVLWFTVGGIIGVWWSS